MAYLPKTHPSSFPSTHFSRRPFRSQAKLARGESALTASTADRSHETVNRSPAAATTLCVSAASDRRTAATVLADTCPHSCWLHLVTTVAGPAHGLPVRLGLGLSQRRDRTPVPVPHGFVHRSHSLHSLQPPSLGGPSVSGGGYLSQFTVHVVRPPRLATEKYRTSSRGATSHCHCSCRPLSLQRSLKTLSFQLCTNQIVLFTGPDLGIREGGLGSKQFSKDLSYMRYIHVYT